VQIEDRNALGPSQSESTPDSRLAVAGQHRQGDDKLDQTDDHLERHIPAWTFFYHHIGELQRGSHYMQYPSYENDEDQPEGPTPAAGDAARQKREECREHQKNTELSGPIAIG